MIKVGIVGAAGRIGSQIERDKLRIKPCSHMGAFKANQLVKVEAACDTQFGIESVVEEFNNTWHVPNCYCSYVDMLDRHDLDIVSVATPADTHFSIVSDIIAHNHHPKIILVEKPIINFTFTNASRMRKFPEARLMIEAAQKRNIILLVNHLRRWTPLYQTIKSMIDSGKLGENVRIVAYASREKDFDGNIHMFDLLNWYGKPYIYVDCWPSEYLIFELNILGSKGRIKIAGNGRSVMSYGSTKSMFYEGINELRYDPYMMPHLDFLTNPWLNLVQHVVSLYNNPTGIVLCTGQDGLNALLAYSRWKTGIPA